MGEIKIMCDSGEVVEYSRVNVIAMYKIHINVLWKSEQQSLD